MTSLTITSRLLSLTDQRRIHDENGELLFEAARKGIFKRDFTVLDARHNPCATLSPEPWKPEPAWQVSGPAAGFTIKRRKKSFERFYWVEGGEHDGVILEGSSHDTRFSIHKGDHIIAEANEKRLSANSAITFELLDDTASTRLLTALAAIIISKEKQNLRTGKRA